MCVLAAFRRTTRSPAKAGYSDYTKGDTALMEDLLPLEEDQLVDSPEPAASAAGLSDGQCPRVIRRQVDDDRGRGAALCKRTAVRQQHRRLIQHRRRAVLSHAFHRQ